MKELVFLAGHFFDYEIPKHREFLYYYFRTPSCQQFLKYLYCFDGDFTHFIEHTGHVCGYKWLWVLRKRHDYLIQLRDKLKRDFELEKLAVLESGNADLTEIEKGNFAPYRNNLESRERYRKIRARRKAKKLGNPYKRFKPGRDD